MRQEGPESSPELRHEHCHEISLPCFLCPQSKAGGGRLMFIENKGGGAYPGGGGWGFSEPRTRLGVDSHNQYLHGQNHDAIAMRIWEPVDHLQGSLGPSEKVRKSPESLEKSRKGPERTTSRLFPDSQGVPGHFFQTFSGFWRARRGRETPCKWSTGSHMWIAIRLSAKPRLVM